MIKIPQHTKGAYNLGAMRIYDVANCKRTDSAVENRSRSSGHMRLNVLSHGRELELNLRGQQGNAIRVRKIQFEIIEVLKKHGFSVGRRERDI